MTWPTKSKPAVRLNLLSGADEVDGAALSVAVSYPDWRIDELREKYAAADAYEPDDIDD